jgi:hypothetical protein
MQTFESVPSNQTFNSWYFRKRCIEFAKMHNYIFPKNYRSSALSFQILNRIVCVLRNMDGNAQSLKPPGYKLKSAGRSGIGFPCMYSSMGGYCLAVFRSRDMQLLTQAVYSDESGSRSLLHLFLHLMYNITE